MKKWFIILCLPLMIFADTMAPAADASTKATISIVAQDGSTIIMKDGTSYQISPKDMGTSGGWFANPADVTISKSNDPNYPLKLTNTATKTSVNAKMMDLTSGVTADSSDKDDSDDGDDSED